MVLADDELKALRDGTLELPSVRCVLERQESEEPERFTGPGVVRQLPDRSLEFTVFLPDVDGPLQKPTPLLGQVLPKQAYFRLTLQDPRGRTWTATYVHPEFRYFFSTGGCMAIGRIHELLSTANIGVEVPRSGLTLHVFTDLEVPPNARSTSVTQEGGFRRESGKLNLAIVDVGAIHFEITRWQSSARVSCTSDVQLPSSLETRVLEALQFVAAHRIAPAVSIHRHGVEERVRLLSHGLAAKLTRAKPPIPSDWVSSPDLVWQLFTKYFEHVLPDTSDEMHPLSLVWDGILRAEAASVDTQALVMTVGVEAIVTYLRQGSAPPEPTGESSATPWAERLLEFLAAEQCEAQTQRRFAKLFEQLNRTRAVDSLHELAKTGTIDKELIEPWKRVRHRAAHGGKAPAEEREQLLYDCDAILCLLHQLVFGIVGYRGKFANYGIRGWPPSDYPLNADPSG